MSIQKIRICVNAFFGDEEIELSFPKNWTIKECRIAGHDKSPLSDEEMRHALQKPFGTPRLREMAKKSKQVCILFDDLPKPTPASRIIPFVLEELHGGGITDEQIRFLCAPGTHRPLTYPEFAAKLGNEIVEKYPVYNHSVWENLVHVGQTTRGTPVYVNREFASCDLRVAIGSIFPHPTAGFGGGGKIILPGICGIETIEYHHKNMRQNSALGRVDDSVFRLDLEEAAILAGLHFKVDAVLNNRREVVGLFAGDLVKEHRAGVELARQLYKTETVTDADVIVLNSYPDEFQLSRSMGCVPGSLHEGGDVVLLTHSHEGQVLHQMSGRFGTDYGGRTYTPARVYRYIEKASKIIIVAPHLSRYDRDMIGPQEKLTWCKTWAEALAELTSRHGADTRVGVYPYAPLQVPFPKTVEASVAST
ncbi:lactate racemase domain-containing protein [Chloroflexota bacterium]